MLTVMLAHVGVVTRHLVGDVQVKVQSTDELCMVLHRVQERLVPTEVPEPEDTNRTIHNIYCHYII